MRLFQAALDTPLDSPFSATLSVHGLHFTACLPMLAKNLARIPLSGLFGITLGAKTLPQKRYPLRELGSYILIPDPPILAWITRKKKKKTRISFSAAPLNPCKKNG